MTDPSDAIPGGLPAMPPFRPGEVWLAGAGPGDPGLLTLTTWQALRRADVVVHDALVDARVLALIPDGVTRESAGKRGGRPSPDQESITERLTTLAGEGRRVLRLKGGDPFVFGRGGEEALGLVEAGVPVRVIPGVTAGTACPGAAGIPLTLKESGSAVTFLTGHDAEGGLPDLDWPAVAGGAPVLVLYMALRTLGAARDRLVAAGRAPDEPAAVIAAGTTPHQRVLDGTLGDLPERAEEAGLAAPALVVVGPPAATGAALRPGLLTDD